jgi:hypothetical protein
MKNKKLSSFKTGEAGFGLGSMLLATLTGGVSYLEGPRAGVRGEWPELVARDNPVY